MASGPLIRSLAAGWDSASLSSETRVTLRKRSLSCVFWKAAAKEMLWFLTGNTNIRPLLQVGVTIWSDWPLAKYRQQTGDEIDQKDFEARIVEDGAGLLLRTTDAGSFFRALAPIILDTGAEVETVTPADENVHAVYDYLIGDTGGPT